MYDHELFVSILSTFTRDLVGSYDPDEVLHGLVERVTEVLGLKGSGVLLVTDGAVAFAAAVPATLSPLEKFQEQTQEGPCVQASVTGSVVAVPDLALEATRWPSYVAEGANLGVRAVAGLPMRFQEQRVGALNLYDGAPRDWSDADLAAAQALADMATVYLMQVSERRQYRELADQLSRALDSRVVIEQAKGMVAEAEQISVDEAFDRIRRWCRNHNERLREAAERIVRNELRP